MTRLRRVRDHTGGTAAPWLRATPGALFGLLRRHAEGLSKSEVVALTGLSRSATSQRIDALLEAGLLVPTSRVGATPVREVPVREVLRGTPWETREREPREPDPRDARGRPAERYTVNLERGVFLVADTGATGMRVAVCDPMGTVLEERYRELDVTDGPRAVLGLVSTGFEDLLDGRSLAGRPLTPGDVLGIGISVPGPVDHDSGRVISPPIMTGWHEFDIPGWFAPTYDCPVVVEKDTNAMVFGEFRAVRPDVRDLVFVKIGTGIGAGLLLRGELYRGADGAAGDIGHLPLSQDDPDAPLCRCGNRGCVEAYAGGWAILRDLRAAGVEVDGIDDLVRSVRAGNRVALDLVRTAATIIGAAVADVVNMVNPRVVAVGGQLAELDDIILATAREVIYRLSLPLATRQLVITASGVDNAGVLGLAALVADHVFAPDRIDRLIIG